MGKAKFAKVRQETCISLWGPVYHPFLSADATERKTQSHTVSTTLGLLSHNSVITEILSLLVQ